MRFSFKNLFKKRGPGHEIAPEEILADASNLIHTDTGNMEGHLILPIERSSYVLLVAVLVFLTLFATVRLFNLQVVRGQELAKRSATNSLDKTIVFANRGLIFDRTGEVVAGNAPAQRWSERKYLPLPGLSVMVGYVGYPKSDSSGNLYDTALAGRDGLEEYFDDVLAGRNGTLIRETNALGELVSESTVENPRDGVNITLSIDAKVTSQLFTELKALAEERGYAGGAGIVIDIETGEVLALTSYPEYDHQVMVDGKDNNAISAFLGNKNNPFLDRASQGLYIPGSIMKPYMAVGALEENIVDPLKNFMANGEIRVPNPYDPKNPTIFKDWKVHGMVDMRRALAVSSNVYFFTIGAGYEGQRGLGISKIEEYMRMFGFGEKTGIEIDGEEEGNVPSPEWKEETFPDDTTWRLGDTYNSSIGQYGFSITPIQAVRATAALANGGFLVTPTLIKDDEQNQDLQKVLSQKGVELKREKETVPVARENIRIVQEGMRKAVLEGTASGLNIPAVAVAAKTGTAELGVTKQAVNSWVMGYFPYQNPRYAFAIAMEKGSRSNTVGATYAMRRLLEWMAIYAPEYLK